MGGWIGRPDESGSVKTAHPESTGNFESNGVSLQVLRNLN